MRLFRAAAALVASVALMSCGGGGGSSGTTPFGSGSGSGTGSTDGSGGTSKPVAADISLGLSATSVNNSGSRTVLATVTAVDAARNALAGVPVTISVDNNAVAQVAGTTTGTDGTLAATISIGADRSNRVITVTATSGSTSRAASFQVTGAQLSATLIPALVAPNSTGNKIQYRLVDVNATPMASQPITITAAGIADTTGTTDNTGSFEYDYVAPSTSGNLDVTASSGGVSLVNTVVVQPTGTGAIANAQGPIQSASISANPSVVSVNSATSNNRSDIRALFLSASNQPIKNVRVRFMLPDPNNIGGTLSTGSSLVYTDANGVATTAYIPGSRSSPTDGVVVRACYSTSDFALAGGACPVSGSVQSKDTTLTVVSEALAVTIGTDNTISDGSGGLTYVKKYVVLVVDSSGQAKPDVQLSASIDLLRYFKGYYDGPGGWNRKAPSAANPTPVAGSIGFTGPGCLNEDVNRNGVLESGEDINNNSQLDPRKSDVAVSFVGPTVTSANGTAVLQIEYPKNVATWLEYKILVSASGVGGTEGRTSWSGTLPADAGSFTATTPPAFVVSPYGISALLPAGLALNPSGTPPTISDGCYNPD